MLRQRVITAIVLVAIVLAALFAPTSVFWRGLISLLVLLGFYEWLRFCEIDSMVNKLLSFMLFIAAFSALQMRLIPIDLVAPIACLVWVGLLIFTLTDYLDLLHNKVAKLFIGIFVISVAGCLVIEIKSVEYGAFWMICFLGAVSLADIGAYFVGRRFGKTKLAPKVSPGKTVEGLFGGLAFVGLIYTPILFSVFEVKQALLLMATVMATALLSVGGDLFESKMKRYVGLKDSSQILPGHGGILDRVDGLLAGAPFFFLGLSHLT